MPIKQPANMAEMLAAINEQRRSLREIRGGLGSAASQAGDLIARAYEHAGDENAEPRGAQMAQAAMRITAALEEIDKALVHMRVITQRASEAVESAEARRKTAARTYKV
jgi:methyl-accepting chemotaxis protein